MALPGSSADLATFCVVNHTLCGPVTTHALNTGPGRRRRRAEVDRLKRRCVGAGRRTEKELAQTWGAAGNVAADQVRVMALKFSRPHHRASENAVAEAWGKSLYLVLYSDGHVSGISVGYVAITPPRVLSGRNSRSIKKAGLR